jgi:hypothetical protein
MKYEVYVIKEACYEIEADSETEALMIADEYLQNRDFDDYEIKVLSEE